MKDRNYIYMYLHYVFPVFSDFISRSCSVSLTLILLHQPETTATFGSIHRLCHSNYDLFTPTLIRSSYLAIKTPVILN
jgi:hypothetical protein